jgi:hypothetical protein
MHPQYELLRQPYTLMLNSVLPVDYHLIETFVTGHLLFWILDFGFWIGDYWSLVIGHAILKVQV